MANLDNDAVVFWFVCEQPHNCAGIKFFSNLFGINEEKDLTRNDVEPRG